MVFLSELKFLSDMGLLLVAVMLINMVLALILVPCSYTVQAEVSRRGHLGASSRSCYRSRALGLSDWSRG